VVSEIDEAAEQGDEPIEFDIREMPIGGVAAVSSVVASVAHQFGPATARVSVFRHDHADPPTSINQEEYEVWVDLAAHPRLPDMIIAAWTSDNDNFRSYCRENVFFVKQPHEPDHWLPEIPSSISGVSTENSSRPVFVALGRRDRYACRFL
jgi:hypothetical protein